MTGPVRWGSVSQAQWNGLLAAGWRGHAGDRMEALYAPSRELATEERRLAAQQRTDRAAIPTGNVVLTVAEVIPGGSPKGNTLVRLSWRGRTVDATAYAAAYTPAAGDRVLCSHVDNQLIVIDRLLG